MIVKHYKLPTGEIYAMQAYNTLLVMNEERIVRWDIPNAVSLLTSENQGTFGYWYMNLAMYLPHKIEELKGLKDEKEPLFYHSVENTGGGCMVAYWFSNTEIISANEECIMCFKPVVMKLPYEKTEAYVERATTEWYEELSHGTPAWIFHFDTPLPHTEPKTPEQVAADRTIKEMRS